MWCKKPQTATTSSIHYKSLLDTFWISLCILSQIRRQVKCLAKRRWVVLYGVLVKGLFGGNRSCDIAKCIQVATERPCWQRIRALFLNLFCDLSRTANCNNDAGYCILGDGRAAAMALLKGEIISCQHIFAIGSHTFCDNISPAPGLSRSGAGIN